MALSGRATAGLVLVLSRRAGMLDPARAWAGVALSAGRRRVGPGEHPRRALGALSFMQGRKRAADADAGARGVGDTGGGTGGDTGVDVGANVDTGRYGYTRPGRGDAGRWHYQADEDETGRAPQGCAGALSAMMMRTDALVVERRIEVANLLVGYEQGNQYDVYDGYTGEQVGYIAEEVGSFGGMIVRNLLRTRRPLRATVFDHTGLPVMSIYRPAFLVASSLYAGLPDSDEIIGEVHTRFNLLRRKYDLFVDRDQFAQVDESVHLFYFSASSRNFTMRNSEFAPMANVSMEWRGFLTDMFTDAHRYAVRMDPYQAASVATPYSGGPFAAIGGGDAVARASGDTEEYCHPEPLDWRQRAMVLANAVSIDNDYFSHHSRGGVNPLVGAFILFGD